ncbi:cytochrome P450 CYP12A2 isoform X1 [Leptinotarsa decemlineata]|uniref:cytochrome P450 CYP12A2 isoform X1 n=1 Tax=Leptinotarsa decemlineata TaxID=7539 RepID=UPI003D30B082
MKLSYIISHLSHSLHFIPITTKILSPVFSADFHCHVHKIRFAVLAENKQGFFEVGCRASHCIDEGVLLQNVGRGYERVQTPRLGFRASIRKNSRPKAADYSGEFAEVTACCWKTTQVSHLEDVESVLRNSGTYPVRKILEIFVYYRRVVRKDIFQDFGGILTVQGEDWFKVRSIVNPILMQSKVIHQYMSKLEGVANELVENMRHFSRLNENHQMPDDFENELYKWALESVGIMALNKHFGCLDLTTPQDSDPKKLVSAILDTFDHLYLIEITPPLWKLFSTPLYKKFVKNLDFINSVIIKSIDEALAEPIDDSIPEHQLSILHRLGKRDKKVAFTMVIDMLISGLDTTGKTLGSILYFLAKNPEKQAKLREEILKVLPEKDSDITAERLEKLSYLRAVIKESTRIAPAAFVSFRTTVKDLVLGGYQIPKGTNVTLVSICTSNSSEHFKDPEKFMPERWLRETDDEYSFKKVNPFASLPFGYGPRKCIGMRFANLELELALIKIIRSFELSWEHPDMEFASHLLYGISNPLKLTVKEVTK